MFLLCVLVSFIPSSEHLARPSKATSKEGNFLIPTEPPRGGPSPVTQSNVAAHLLTQFGLQVHCISSLCQKYVSCVSHRLPSAFSSIYLPYPQLLHVSLKREKIVPSTPEHVAMLDPFVPLLATTIKSKHVPVSCHTYICAWYYSPQC